MQPWCNTCGKTVPEKTYLKNSGECNACREWWDKQEIGDDIWATEEILG